MNDNEDADGIMILVVKLAFMAFALWLAFQFISA